MSVDIVSFDLDGTLVDTAAEHARAGRRANAAATVTPHMGRLASLRCRD